MPQFKLTLAYDGTEFCGWQAQPGRRTVQGVLEEAVQRVVGAAVRVGAASRTDAGVHALGQVAAFAAHTRLEADVLARAVNAYLPPDVAVLALEQVDGGFHPTHHAAGKRYRYVIRDAPGRDVFARRYHWQVHEPLDAEAMHRAGQALAGRHDFASFQSAGSPREDTVRTIFALDVARGGAGESDRIRIEVEGDGFLYNMVRAIAGTLVEVGRGKQPEGWPGETLAARDRSAAGPTAPPQGLFLLWVRY